MWRGNAVGSVDALGREVPSILAGAGRSGPEVRTVRPDHDLERYHPGMVKTESELASIKEHLLWCHSCVGRAEETGQYVDESTSHYHLRSNDLRSQLDKSAAASYVAWRNSSSVFSGDAACRTVS